MPVLCLGRLINSPRGWAEWMKGIAPHSAVSIKGKPRRNMLPVLPAKAMQLIAFGDVVFTRWSETDLMIPYLKFYLIPLLSQ